jgi:arabinofuranosyltransferase
VHRRKLVWILPLLLFAIHTAYYYPFLADDAFISLRYARRLIDGHGLTWNDGERVEGYSNLLWVLLTASVGSIGIDLVLAARILGILCTLATMGAFVYYRRRLALGESALLWTQLAFVTSAPVAIWSIGGLETSLVMALLAWSYVLSAESLDRRRAIVIGVLQGGLATLRPEGLLFTIMIGCGLLVFGHGPRAKRWSCATMIWSIASAFAAGQIVFRLTYYGAWLPNTVHAKVALTTDRLQDGIRYTLKGVLAFLPLLPVVIRTTTLSPRDIRRQKLFVCIAAAWMILVTVGGGDTFPGYRHVLPVIPLVMLLAMGGFDEWRRIRPTTVHAAAGSVLLVFAAVQSAADLNHQAKTERWEWRGRELGERLKALYSTTRPLVAVTAAGSIPYYSELPSLDMFGLNDAYVTRHRPAAFGHGYPGNELFSPDYVLSRKPDIIVWHVGDESFPTGVDPSFAGRDYEERTLELPSYTARIFVRRDSALVHR